MKSSYKCWIAEYLEELGFKSEVAGSPASRDAKLALLKGEFAAAIVDIGLPDATGDALVGELRGIYPGLPILVASGQNPRPRCWISFKSHERMAVLAKPYTIAQLNSRAPLDRRSRIDMKRRRQRDPVGETKAPVGGDLEARAPGDLPGVTRRFVQNRTLSVPTVRSLPKIKRSLLAKKVPLSPCRIPFRQSHTPCV